MFDVATEKQKLLAQLENPHLSDSQIEQINRKLEILENHEE